MLPRVLLLDDDVELVSMLSDYLSHDGFSPVVAHDGSTGLSLASRFPFDAMVLDIMMPEMNGIDVLTELRKTSDMPVIMLTARGDDADRIRGLELGADDYVAKPCTAREISARLRAILRRCEPNSARQAVQSPIVVSDLVIRPSERTAECNGVLLSLTSSEYNILELLAKHAGQPVNRETLSVEALGRPLEPYDRAIDVHLHAIRSKLPQLEDGSSRIRTVYRKGYQLVIGA